MPSHNAINLLNINKLFKKNFYKTKLFQKDLNFISSLAKMNLIQFLEKIEHDEFIIFLNNNSKL